MRHQKTNKRYLTALMAASILLLTGVVSANEISGVFKTEPSDKGYLLVNVEPCGDKICGTIKDAFDLEGQPMVDYEHKGKQMIWDMVPSGEGNWSKGKIWDPSKDKTYKSKMSLSGDTLNVSGCIAFICRSQSWQRSE